MKEFFGWHAHAACRGMGLELFFGQEEDGQLNPRGHAELQEAKRICAQCPVRRECYDEGRYELYGIWGGLTRVERLHKRLGYSDFAMTLKESA